MKNLRRLILLTLSATLLSGCSLFKPINDKPGEQQQESASLKSITATGYTSFVYQNEIYSFDGKVTAYYSDSTSKEVANYTVTPLDTSETGNSPITIFYSENGTKVESSIYISIISKGSEDVPVTGVTLSETSRTIKVGESFTLNAYVEPSDATNKQVRWSSSNSSVATVNNGYVVAVSSGTTIITVTTVDGSKTAQCTVTVAESKVLVTGVTFTETSKSMVVGDTYDINYTVLPSNASNKSLTWSSSRSTVASVSSTGKVTAKATGTATITAKSNDGSNKQATLTVTVSKPTVAVTGISLNKTSLSLKNGEQAQLTATVTPSDATDKTVTWSGSANGITVNSSGLVSVSSTATVGKTATIVATAHGNTSKTASCVVTVAETPVGERDAWTLLIYMCGADLESDRSQGGAATEDLSEIYSIRSSLPNDVNVVVQAGGASSWKSTYSSVISKDKCNRFHLTKTGFVSDSQTTKVNMGLDTTLESFVEWGLKTYPADKVGLVFWNHGGAMDGCCFDEQFSNDGLTPAEVATAIPTAISRSNYNQKLEFIGYDCCLMSIQDIAGLNSEYAKYMIASEEAEWGYGWTYNEWVDDLFAKSSTETILKACVDSFYSETEEVYDYYGEDNDQTLAYYNLQNWDAYETAWEDFSQYLSSSVIKSSSNWTTFSNVVNSAKKYGQYTDKQLQSYNNGYICDIFDVKDFLNKFKASSSYKSNTTLMSKVSSVLTAFTGLNVYSKCGSAAGNSYGLCMFCPISGYNVKDVQYDENNTCFTSWRSLCRTYGNWYY